MINNMLVSYDPGMDVAIATPPASQQVWGTILVLVYIKHFVECKNLRSFMYISLIWFSIPRQRSALDCYASSVPAILD